MEYKGNMLTVIIKDEESQGSEILWFRWNFDEAKDTEKGMLY